MVVEGTAVEAKAGVAGGTAMEAELGVAGDAVAEVVAIPAVGSSGSDSLGVESLTLSGEDSEEMASEVVVPKAGPADPLVVQFSEDDA